MSGQAHLGQFKLDPVKSVYDNIGHGRSRQIDLRKLKSGHFKSRQVQYEQVKSGQVKSGQVKSGQIKTGLVKSSQYRSRQFWTCQIKSGQVKIGQVVKMKTYTWNSSVALLSPNCFMLKLIEDTNAPVSSIWTRCCAFIVRLPCLLSLRGWNMNPYIEIQRSLAVFELCSIRIEGDWWLKWESWLIWNNLCLVQFRRGSQICQNSTKI